MTNFANAIELPTFETDRLSSITMIATANNTAVLKTNYNKMTADMTLAASGAQSFIKAEALSTKAFKGISDNLKILVTKISNGKQSEAICDLLQSYVDAKAILQKKIILQKAASTAFNTAIVSAQKMRTNESPNDPGADQNVLSARGPAEYAACTKKILSAANINETAITCGSIGAIELRNKSSIAKASIIAFLKEREKVLDSKTNNADTKNIRQKMDADISSLDLAHIRIQSMELPTCAPLLNEVKITCLKFANKLTANQAFTRPPANKNSKDKAKEKEKENETSAIQASDMFTLGDESTGIIKILAPELAAEADKYMFTPGKRIIHWQVIKWRADDAVNATQAEIKKIDSNIEKTKKLIHGFVKNDTIYEKIANLFISKSYAETNTESLRMAAGFEDLSPAFSVFALQVTRFSDELNDANSMSSKSIANANLLASKDASITKILKPLQRSNDLKLQNDLLKKFNDITKSVLKKKGISPSQVIASYGKSLLGKSEILSHSSKTIFKKIDHDNSLNANNDSFEQNKNLQSESFTGMGQGEYHPTAIKYKLNDISRNKEESIFTVISNRYLKSAYPALLGPLE